MGRHVRTIHQGALPLNALRSATTSFTGVAGRKAFCAILAGITTPISQLLIPPSSCFLKIIDVISRYIRLNSFPISILDRDNNSSLISSIIFK